MNPVNTRPIRILLVDDDPVFTLFTCQLLKSLDAGSPCKIATLADGQAALKEIHHNRYDLALLDYSLPGANGLEILAEIQTLPLDRRPAVIMLTASGNESLAVEAMKQGAKDYVPKVNLDQPSLTRAIQSALNQKRLADQVQAYHTQLEADLDLARQLQQSLLPRHYPSFPGSATPEASALRFHHRFFWTTQLGGDFFSVQDLSDSQAGVLICDVMGHGVRSALVTAMLRALVGDLAADANHPDRFLSGMNQRLNAILKEVGDTLFATACYLIADVGCGKVRYARAGHPPPLHLRRRAGVAEPLPFPKSAGPALGLFSDATYIACERELAEDDLLLLFTDGLFEVTGPDGNEFGSARLLQAARERMHLPLAGVVDGLIDDVRQFCRSNEFEDDVCLLGVEAVRRIP
jgi:sigma-B regulation protein RsbU (phosphoserine phosphatase)